MKNSLIIAALLVVVVLFYAFLPGLQSYLTLETLKTYQASLTESVSENPVGAGISFGLVYIFVTALSIPGAVILTLAGGALFGLFWGTIMVSIASTVGATLAFLIVRSLFGNLVRQKFSAKFERISRGFERDGASYLFSLRLVPAIPFFVVNILMALTPIRTIQYFLVSLLGMLPATVVYVNAGTELSKIQSVNDILSTRLLFSFVLIATFPWVARFALKAFKGNAS